jgi:hypothetical protein
VSRRIRIIDELRKIGSIEKVTATGLGGVGCDKSCKRAGKSLLQ